MERLSKRDQILLLIIILAIIFYGYYQFYLTPALNKVQITRTEISNLKQQLNNIKQDELINKQLMKQIEDLQTRVKENEAALPYSPREPELITRIEDFCHGSNVTFINLSFNESSEYKLTDDKAKAKDSVTATPGGKLMIIPVTFSFKGDFLSIMNFISSLEGDKRLNSIDSLSLTPNGSLIQGNLSLNYYYINNGKNDVEIKYDLSKGSFGKDNLFN